jgi:hypothetical protein
VPNYWIKVLQVVFLLLLLYLGCAANQSNILFGYLFLSAGSGSSGSCYVFSGAFWLDIAGNTTTADVQWTFLNYFSLPISGICLFHLWSLFMVKKKKHGFRSRSYSLAVPDYQDFRIIKGAIHSKLNCAKNLHKKLNVQVSHQVCQYFCQLCSVPWYDAIVVSAGKLRKLWDSLSELHSSLCERQLERTVLRPALLPVKTAQFTQFYCQVWYHTVKSLSLTEIVLGA